MDKSLDFYTRLLGMKLLRLHDYPEGKFTLAFIGFEEETKQAMLELTYNWDVHQYELGTAFGHIAIGVTDVYKTCNNIREKGGKIKRDAGPMKGGTDVIAFVEDPNGYTIELLEDKR